MRKIAMPSEEMAEKLLSPEERRARQEELQRKRDRADEPQK